MARTRRRQAIAVHSEQVITGTNQGDPIYTTVVTQSFDFSVLAAATYDVELEFVESSIGLLTQHATAVMSPATEMFSEIVTLSVPLPGFATPKLSVSAVLGDAGVGLGVLAVTAMPGRNPTVTLTEPLTAA